MIHYIDMRDMLEEYIKQEGELEGIKWIACALHNILITTTAEKKEVNEKTK